MTTALLSPAVGIEQVAEIVRIRLADMGRNQTWLGAEIATVMGRDLPWAQTAVSQWLRGTTTPDPEVIFAMERALGVRPGDLSRHLGYLPVAAKPSPMTVEAAIQADPKLPDKLKRALTVAYREMVGD